MISREKVKTMNKKNYCDEDEKCTARTTKESRECEFACTEFAYSTCDYICYIDMHCNCEAAARARLEQAAVRSRRKEQNERNEKNHKSV